MLSKDTAMLELEHLEQCGRSTSFFERFRSFKLQLDRLASLEMMLQFARTPAKDCWKGDALSTDTAMLELDALNKAVVLYRFLSDLACLNCNRTGLHQLR